MEKKKKEKNLLPSFYLCTLMYTRINLMMQYSTNCNITYMLQIIQIQAKFNNETVSAWHKSEEFQLLRFLRFVKCQCCPYVCMQETVRVATQWVRPSVSISSFHQYTHFLCTDMYDPETIMIKQRNPKSKHWTFKITDRRILFFFQRNTFQVITGSDLHVTSWFLSLFCLQLEQLHHVLLPSLLDI